MSVVSFRISALASRGRAGRTGIRWCAAGKAHFANRINKAYQAQQSSYGRGVHILKPSMSASLWSSSLSTGREMRLSVLIDKLALRSGGIQNAHKMRMKSSARRSTPSPQPLPYASSSNSNSSSSCKTLCQPISHVVRGDRTLYRPRPRGLCVFRQPLATVERH